MKYKAILFDMDGTVLDTLQDLNAAVNRTLSEFGYPPQSLDETRRKVGNGSRRLMELSLPENTPKGTVEALLSWYLPYYNEHANDSTSPYPGITVLLGLLKAEHYPVAVVSNKPDRTVKELAAIHFPDLLDIAVGENEAGGVRRKPWPDTLLAASAALGVDPGDCLYVGDSEVDVVTAARAGMDCASVLWGFRNRTELEEAGAGLFFETPAELGDYLLND